MLSRLHRFHGYGSLRFVYQHGRTIRGQLFSLKVVHNDRRQTYRCAIVVSRKVNKSAVVRNRIRRRLYELVRKHQAIIPAQTDLIITVYGEKVADMPAAELEKALLPLLKKIKTQAN